MTQKLNWNFASMLTNMINFLPRTTKPSLNLKFEYKTKGVIKDSNIQGEPGDKFDVEVKIVDDTHDEEIMIVEIPKSIHLLREYKVQTLFDYKCNPAN